MWMCEILFEIGKNFYLDFSDVEGGRAKDEV
jgi:hypothetical protein